MFKRVRRKSKNVPVYNRLPKWMSLSRLWLLRINAFSLRLLVSSILSGDNIFLAPCFWKNRKAWILLQYRSFQLFRFFSEQYKNLHPFKIFFRENSSNFDRKGLKQKVQPAPYRRKKQNSLHGLHLLGCTRYSTARKSSRVMKKSQINNFIRNA